MSSSSHMGKERVNLERIRVLEIKKNKLYDELIGIIGVLANKNSEYREKREQFDLLEKEISKLENKVEHHIQMQLRNE